MKPNIFSQQLKLKSTKQCLWVVPMGIWWVKGLLHKERSNPKNVLVHAMIILDTWVVCTLYQSKWVPCVAGLLRHNKEAHGPAVYPEQARLGPVRGPVAVLWRCLAHARQLLGLQSQDLSCLQVWSQGARAILVFMHRLTTSYSSISLSCGRLLEAK